MLARALPLPPPLVRPFDDAAAAFLRPEGAPAIDFSAPEGAPALIAADSLSWRIFKNPLAVYLGGVAAVLLELAEPRVRDGVWEHSRFRTDPIGRLRRTGLAAMVTVYGPCEIAERMIAGIRRLHAGIAGTIADGRPYRADDPDLLDWVQATAEYGILEAYSVHVRPLCRSERDRACREALPAAALYGAIGAPNSWTAMEAMFEARRGALAPSPIVFRFLDILGRAPLLPLPARPAQPILLRAAVSLLPSWVRERLGLGARWSLRPWERPLVSAAARAADLILLPSHPAVQSCRRLGLPQSFLFR